MKNEIYLRRKNKMIIDNGNVENPNMQYIITIIKNLENWGYTLSQTVVEVLKTKSSQELETFYLETIGIIKSLVGSKAYKPMYPNFPQQVMEADYVELFINAMVHYWTLGELLPEYQVNERLPLFDTTKIKVVDLGSEDEFTKIFTNLMQSKTSISEADKSDLIWFFKNYSNHAKYLPKEIPLKENIALIGKVILEESPLATSNNIKNYFKTATDVLRLITAMSDGDISLATNTRFRNFKRKERRIFLDLLENCNSIEEDMLRYKNKWIRVGEKLHPTEYNSYNKTKTSFNKLRNDIKIETFGGKVVKAIDEKDYKTALYTLKQRAGELARKLDYLLRISDDKNMIINTFKDVAKDVSTPVLLQVREHFKVRNCTTSDIRVFFPKGNVAKAHCIDNNLTEIEEKYCQAIVNICENALIENYKQKDFMGNVYLSEKFKNYLVPFSQRSASRALKTIVRGSRIPLDDNFKTIRSFIWWKDGQERTDLDLSAVMYDENWSYKEHISYTNLRSSTYNACHSGDITSAPNGASEFIDIDVDSVVKYGGRYVVFNVLSYTEQPFTELPECFMGWMGRENPKSGEIYEPKTVQNKIDLTANTQICIPMILDLVDKVIIWTDIALKHEAKWQNNIEVNGHGIAITCKALAEMVKPNLYDLINMHIKARGIKCEDKDKADVIFDINDGITPFDTEIFMGEYI